MRLRTLSLDRSKCSLVISKRKHAPGSRYLIAWLGRCAWLHEKGSSSRGSKYLSIHEVALRELRIRHKNVYGLPWALKAEADGIGLISLPGGTTRTSKQTPPARIFPSLASVCSIWVSSSRSSGHLGYSEPVLALTWMCLPSMAIDLRMDKRSHARPAAARRVAADRSLVRVGFVLRQRPIESFIYCLRQCDPFDCHSGQAVASN